MALLKRLFPWYRWSDRWAFHVENIGLAYQTTPLFWTCPDDSLHQILGLTGTAIGSAFGSGIVISVSARRGSHMFACVRSLYIVPAGDTTTASFSVGAYPLTRDTTLHILNSTLPMNFILLPGDTLRIATSGSALGDTYKDIVLSSKRWLI